MQSNIDPAELPDDPRLLRAVKEFSDQLESGHQPDRQEFLRRYPDLAEPLAQCLAGLELVHKAAVPESKPSRGPMGVCPGDSLPANPLGDFQIMREIGRGGMGIVYEAVQLSLGRRVALKVLPFAATFDNKHLQRFHNEAQAAAQLHHTNIVPIYYVGSDRGVHFYAMQLIEGHSLAVIIRQIRRQTGRSAAEPQAVKGAVPNNGNWAGQDTIAYPEVLPMPNESSGSETVSQVALALTTQRSSKHETFFSTAARFVMQAGEALDHAHQFGIVHRDIKPANLLVDTHGRLWITDFGLAQFRAEAGLTRTGDLLGTLRYMSPEQASGQRVLLDHRTDVYSLGATLYELVTLEPMFSEQDHQALLYQILHDEPRAPRSTDKSVPVDLETIILKAVSKNPADRYATAQEFAADLQRYLEDKPIRAKRPSLVERARKWSRRHPSWVAASILLLLVCIAGLIVNNRMIAGEEVKTKAALEGERKRAQQARDAVDLLVQISEEELADQPFSENTRKKLLIAALAYYQDFYEQQQGNPKAQEELAQGRDRVQQLLDKLTTMQGAYQIFLVREPAVQADLKLTDDQKTRISNLRNRWTDQSMPHFRDSEKLYQVAKENEAALAQILDAGQLQRLRQIRLQKQGPGAFHEPEVMDALRLTAEQKKKIKEIEAKAFSTMWPGPDHGDGPGGPPPPEAGKGPGGFRGGPGHGEGGPGKRGGGRDGFGGERMKCFEDSMKEQVEQVVSILSPEQQDKWRSLTGEPFKGGPMFGPGPRPFGQP